jgi:hypothetical protein
MAILVLSHLGTDGQSEILVSNIGLPYDSLYFMESILQKKFTQLFGFIKKKVKIPESPFTS